MKSTLLGFFVIACLTFASAALFLFCVCIGAVIFGDDDIGIPWHNSDPGVIQAKERGNRLIVAIEKYKRDNQGIAPVHLEQLLPDYIQEIGVPGIGMDAWQYERIGHGFRLEFSSISRYNRKWFNSDVNKWSDE